MHPSYNFLQVFQLGVILQPSSSEALCHLGNGQVMQYDAAAGATPSSSEGHWLQDAELSFRASIDLEGKAILPSVIPGKLKEEKWWKEREAAAAAKVAKSSSPPSKTQPALSGGGPKKPVGGAAGRGAPSRQQPAARQPPAGRGRTTAAPKAQAAAGRSGSSGGAAKVTGGPAGRGGAKAPVRSGPAAAGAQKTAGKTPTGGAGGKGVATLGELKSGANGKTAPPTNTAASASKDTPPPPQQPPQGPAEINQPSYHPRLGLARTLAKTGDAKKMEEAHTLYKKVMAMSPDVHDAYIELGELLAKTDPEGAVEVYSKFPFSDPPTFDDAFLHGEIVRLLMKSEKYENPGLASSMIAMGKALGIGILEKQVSVLEAKFKSSLLKTIYAGVHSKPVDDPELQAFFKFKCWL